MADALRLRSGLAWLRSCLSRRPVSLSDNTLALPPEIREAPFLNEPAVVWTVNGSELGEMAAVAIELLDLAGRRRRRGD